MTGWQNKPFETKAKKGDTIAFCMCGKSKNGPYCDGSHEGTGITPKGQGLVESITDLLEWLRKWSKK